MFSLDSSMVDLNPNSFMSDLQTAYDLADVTNVHGNTAGATQFADKNHALLAETIHAFADYTESARAFSRADKVTHLLDDFAAAAVNAAYNAQPTVPTACKKRPRRMSQVSRMLCTVNMIDSDSLARKNSITLDILNRRSYDKMPSIKFAKILTNKKTSTAVVKATTPSF